MKMKRKSFKSNDYNDGITKKLALSWVLGSSFLKFGWIFDAKMGS